ncbi:hypothetical protein C7S20_02215 [Christiangramia fulva]|uniref:Uncharacterized protein n=1 Tax=Christiangramia fulva TaxID=2126553 RepID=A0A2R3Z1P6_9FLAO|nr:gliding motility-associated C-terminal domain-containing protein [Christiangramia fulva]AVR44174.1 hypothetical protein C7S20_02215 [Christiangramia fulva]
MQNFTLRFKGKIFYLLTLTLLIGSLPSIYGQACPTVDNSSQSFCNALSTVADLKANGDNVKWYAEATSSTALPIDRILQDGEDYFADSPDCTDSGFTRPSVTVSITGPATPVVQDDFFTPCSGGGPYTIADLKEAIDAAPAPSGYTLEIFSSRYDRNATPLADTDPLSVGNYYAGYYDAGTGCQSKRKPVRFEPVELSAPTETVPDEVCEGTTLGELSQYVQGDKNLWYDTPTSEPNLADDDLVQNGTTYYVSQVKPSDGPPCESERTEVIFTVLPADAGPDNTDNTLCVSDADSQLNNETNARAYFLSLLEYNNDSDTSNDVPDTGNFDMATLTEIVADYNDGTKAGYYETTYTVSFSNGCEDSVILGVTVAADPNPGTDKEQDVCITELAPLVPLAASNINAVETAIRTYLGGTGLDTDGEFTPGISDFIATLSNDIDNNNFPKTYTIEYTVNNDGCEKSATATLNVFPENNAGTTNSDEMCQTDVDAEGIFANEASLKTYYLQLLGTDDASGSFNPPLNTLITNYNDGITDPSEDFTTEYTVDNGVCAPAMATATLTVIKAIPADAGTGTGDTFCSNEDTDLDLYTFLSGDYGVGTFSSDNAEVGDATFNPSEEGVGSYDITYTVSPETDCVTTTASTTFTINVNQAPNAGPGGKFSFCKAEFEAIAATALTNPSALLDEFSLDITPDGDFTGDNLITLLTKYGSTTEFPATFTTTYTVSNSDCTDSATYSVTITPNTVVSAGGDKNMENPICSTDDLQDLSTYLGDGATSGGVFSSDNLTITDGQFDPSAETTGDHSFTYTVNGDTDSDPCTIGNDMATITFTITEGIEIAPVEPKIICGEDIDENFFTEDALTAYYLGLIDNDVPTEGGSFNPDIPTIIQDYNNGDTTLTTVYSLNNEPCNNSVELSIVIRDNIVAELTEVEDPDPICQNAGIQDLTDFIGSNPDFGRFVGYDEGTFNPGEEGEGVYTITYILDEEASCVTGSDSITFDITVLGSAYAGSAKTLNVCQNSGTLKLFSKLDQGVDKTGTFTFESTGEVIVDGEIDPSDLEPKVYNIIYTVKAENDCGDAKAVFKLNVRAVPNAGADTSEPEEVCQNLDTFDLSTLLSADAQSGGKFTVNGNTVDKEIIPSDFDSDTIYNFFYMVSNNSGACSDSAILQVKFLDAANAGEGSNITACSNDSTTINLLTDYVSVDADQNGTFTFKETDEVIANGEIIPSELDPAAYNSTVVYTVPATNDCGDDTAEFQLNISPAPDAPDVNDISFCAIQSPTGANLMEEGENLTFYTDATLETMVLETDELVSGTYYVTQRTSEDGCESDATEFTVTINDPGTPTIDNASLSFCEYDDPKVADLSSAVDQTSNVTWYASVDSTDPLNTSTALQSGKYYATLYDPATDCESSQRLEVTVTIENCPLVFPEGISPNGDQKNDTFVIEHIERYYPNYIIKIHNRWGDLVYKGGANTPNWDGTSNQSGALGNDVLPVGVYFYLLDFNDGVTPPKRGKIYLSR